jgi:hypothetical protein
VMASVARRWQIFRLFDIAAFADSSGKGCFMATTAESRAHVMRKALPDELLGNQESFPRPRGTSWEMRIRMPVCEPPACDLPDGQSKMLLASFTAKITVTAIMQQQSLSTQR